MIVAPPWRLRASGYAVLFAPSRPRRVRAPASSPCGRIRYLGGFGLLLLLDYAQSEVGPYREALYIPGYASIRVKARTAAGRDPAPSRTAPFRRGHSITWIVVSTEDSRNGGIANWGIPKRLGAILGLPGSSGEKRFLVTGENGDRLLSVEIPQRGVGLPPLPRRSLPLHSLLLPHTLVQSAGSTVYSTRVEASVRLRAARRAKITSYADETAEIAARRVLATFSISNARLRFPPATRY